MAVLRWLFAGVLLVVLSPISLAIALEDESGRQVLSGSHSDQQFVAGERVWIDAQVSDDIYAAGRDVQAAGASADNFMAVGHALSLDGVRVREALLAGGGLEFSGDVADDLIAIACPICPGTSHRLHLKKEAVIGDDARLLAEEVDVDGSVGGDLYAAGRLITLSGTVLGTADLLAERIVVASTARIAGDLIYRNEVAPEIAEGAVIGGEIRHLPLVDIEKRERPPPLAVLSWYALAILSYVLLGAVLQFALPDLLGRSAERLGQKPLASLGLGAALLFLTPIGAALLAVTLIGIPVALLLMALLCISLALSFVTASHWIGMGATRWSRMAAEGVTRGRRIAATSLGIVVLGILAMIPIVGGLVVFAALLFGLGAFTHEAWQQLRAPVA